MSTPDEKLLIAATHGDIEAAQRAFAEGATVDSHGSASETPLQWAARNNHLEMARFLIDEKGADVNQRGQFQNMSLHEAASRGHKEMVELLLDRGAIPDPEGRFPHGRPVNGSWRYPDITKILEEATERARRTEKSTIAQSQTAPRQDFPPESFNHLEDQLGNVRKRVMRLATKKALDEHSQGPIYVVSKAHVDSALRELIPNISELATDPDAGRGPKPKATHAADATNPDITTITHANRVPGPKRTYAADDGTKGIFKPAPRSGEI